MWLVNNWHSNLPHRYFVRFEYHRYQNKSNRRCSLRKWSDHSEKNNIFLKIKQKLKNIAIKKMKNKMCFEIRDGR